MALPPEERRDRVKVNAASRKAPHAVGWNRMWGELRVMHWGAASVGGATLSDLLPPAYPARLSNIDHRQPRNTKKPPPRDFGSMH